MTFPPGYRVMVTGHRSVRGERAELVRGVLRGVLERLQVRHTEGIVAVCGMAVGADAEFAEAALSLGVPLVAAVPVETQSDPWPLEARWRYDRFIAQACLVVEVWKDPDYRAQTIGSQMFARDRWMIDNSDLTVAVWDGRVSGGTWHTVREAFRRGRKVLVVNPSTGALRVDTPKAGVRRQAKAASFGTPYEGSLLDMFGDLTTESGRFSPAYDLVVKPYVSMFAELMEEMRYKPVMLDPEVSFGDAWHEEPDGRVFDIDYAQLEMRVVAKLGEQTRKAGLHDDLVDAMRYSFSPTARFRGVDDPRRRG